MAPINPAIPYLITNFPPSRYPYTNIQPFTYRAGITYAEKLDELGAWLVQILIPFIDENLDAFGIEFRDIVTELVNTVNTALTNHNSTIDQRLDENEAAVNTAIQQVIDAHISFTDPVVSGIWQNISSTFRSLLDGSYSRVDEWFINPERHGIVGDGIADDTVTMQSLIDSVPDGATIRAPRGAIYRTDGWFIRGKSITLDLSKAHVIKTGSDPIITAEGEYDIIRPVNTVAAGRNSVTVTDSEGFKVGDVIKLYANNAIWDARPDPDDSSLYPRVGHLAIVTEVPDAITVNFSPPFDRTDNYTSSPRLARLANHVVKIEIGTADYADGASSAMFRIRDLPHPDFRAHSLRAPNAVFGARSCYGGFVHLISDNAPLGDGYGVILGGCSGMRIDVHTRLGRHAFSDGPADNSTVAGDTNPSLYGRTTNNIITGVAYGSREAAFDTHHGSVGNIFDNVVVDGVVTATAGISLRGRNHIVNNPSVSNTSYGIRVHDEGDFDWATSYGHRVSAMSTREVATPVYVVLSRRRPASDGATLTVDGGYMEWGYGPAIVNIYGTLRLNNPIMRQSVPTVDGGGGWNHVIHSGTATYYGEITLDMLGTLAGSLDSLVYFPDSGANRSLVNLIVHADLSEYIAANIAVLLRANTVLGRVHFDLNRMIAGTAIGTTLLTEEEQSVTFKARIYDETDYKLSSASISTSATAGGVISLLRSGDPIVYVRLAAAAAVTTGEIRPGAFVGQMIVLHASGNNGGSITIPSGGTVNGQSVIAPGSAVRRIWDGSVWIVA